jgi:hypothetical protein
MCLRIFDAWHQMRDSEIAGELLLGGSTRSPEALAGEEATRAAQIARGRATPQPVQAPVANRPRRARRPSRRERQDVQRQRERRSWATTLVKALPPALRTALALSVIVNFERHWHDAEVRREHAKNLEPALSALAQPLFEYSARRWSGRFKPNARFGAYASLLAPGEPPRCDARAVSRGAFGKLALPISWFTDVWARDIALLDHCFVLGLAHELGEEDQLGVYALRWEHQDWKTARSLVAPALVIERGRGDWRLRWL